MVMTCDHERKKIVEIVETLISGGDSDRARRVISAAEHLCKSDLSSLEVEALVVTLRHLRNLPVSARQQVLKEVSDNSGLTDSTADKGPALVLSDLETELAPVR